MAATGQGQAGGEGAAQAQQGQGEGQGPDLSALSEQVGGINTSLEEMRGILQGLTPAQQAEVQQAGEEIDLSWLDNPTIDPAQQQQLMQQEFERIADQRAQALVAPVIERQEQARINTEARDLADRFPELQDADAAKRLAGPGGLVEQALSQANLPPQVAKQIAAEPWFWGMVHMADKAATVANSEGSGDPGAAHLEHGGGASPAPMSQADLVKAIVNSGSGAGLGARVLDGL